MDYIEPYSSRAPYMISIGQFLVYSSLNPQFIVCAACAQMTSYIFILILYSACACTISYSLCAVCTWAMSMDACCSPACCASLHVSTILHEACQAALQTCSPLCDWRDMLLPVHMAFCPDNLEVCLSVSVSVCTQSDLHSKNPFRLNCSLM